MKRSATFGPSEEGTIMRLAPDHHETGVTSYLAHYEELHHTCPVPFDGIAVLLQFLQAKKVRIAMVTGKGEHSTAISLRQFGLTHFFERIETGSPAGPRKAEGIQLVAEFFAGIEIRNAVRWRCPQRYNRQS